MYPFQSNGTRVPQFRSVDEGGRFEWNRSGAWISLGTHLHPGDRRAFRNASLTLGLYQTDSVTVIVARWRDWMTVDMPYNAALYPSGQRPQTSLILAGTSQTRLSVPMRLIDLNLNASVATRLILAAVRAPACRRGRTADGRRHESGDAQRGGRQHPRSFPKSRRLARRLLTR